jgi:hypothetical protein
VARAQLLRRMAAPSRSGLEPTKTVKTVRIVGLQEYRYRRAIVDSTTITTHSDRRVGAQNWCCRSTFSNSGGVVRHKNFGAIVVRSFNGSFLPESVFILFSWRARIGMK